MNKKKEKEITNTELLKSINRSFSRVEGKLNKVEEKLEKKIDAIDIKVEGVKSQVAGVNNRIDDISLNRVKYEDFNNLKTRVQHLEMKVK